MIEVVILGVGLGAAIARHRSKGENGEGYMSVIVKGLANTVRKAKSGIERAGKSAQELSASAENLSSVVDRVDTMKAELDGAAAELQGALGELSNGGPPLDDLKTAVSSFEAADGAVAKDAHAATVKVGAANK